MLKKIICVVLVLQALVAGFLLFTKIISSPRIFWYAPLPSKGLAPDIESQLNDAVSLARDELTSKYGDDILVVDDIAKFVHEDNNLLILSVDFVVGEEGNSQGISALDVLCTERYDIWLDLTRIENGLHPCVVMSQNDTVFQPVDIGSLVSP